MPDTMIERVARALAGCAASRAYRRDASFMQMKFSDTGDARFGPPEVYAEAHWPTYTDDARAAIAAMREPTEGMQFAACNRLMDFGYQTCPIESGLAYTAAIDAALAEEG